MTADISALSVRSDSSIGQAIACIDRNQKGIALVVDEERHLIGTITDGDIRRAILAGLDLSVQVAEILKRKADSPYSHPVTAPAEASHSALLHLMRQHSIRQIPLLSTDGRVEDLVVLDDLVSAGSLDVTAVIMAGGLGSRLRPLTDKTPKPMLHVGGRPLMEWIVEGLRQAGIYHIVVTTSYESEIIVRHFGDGQRFGVGIEYVHEEQLSGTAGSLRLLPPWQQPLLVINGDILTRVDFRAMLHYHQEHTADMTTAVREYHLQVPYGVVEMDDARIRTLTEKPSLRFFVNAGIYLLEPSVRSCLPEDGSLDMTDLIQRLLRDNRRAVGFPVREYWIDIGQQADYEQAQDDMRGKRF